MSDLVRQNDQLRRILDVARYMAVTNDLDVLLGAIVEAVCEVLECERATIFLFDRERDELYSRVARGVDDIRFSADRGIAGAAARERKMVNVPDAYADERFNPEVDKETGFRTRNLLTFPLENLAGDLIGVLQALNRNDGPFSKEDEKLADVLAAQAGVALDRARLMEEFAEKQRMQRDLEVAREIQQKLFPRKSPHVDGYEIAGWNRSADETGGDCYDFVPLPDGRVAIVLADATGHGIGAALIIAQCRSLIRAMLSVTDDLPAIAAGVNDLLADDLAADRFVTAFLGILDPKRHVIDYISGGQGPLMHLSGNFVEQRNANALPFAVIPGTDYDEPHHFKFPLAATLILLTDGFYEAQDPSGDFYGEARTAEFIRRHGAAELERLIADLHADVQTFMQGAPQADDLTAVLVRRIG